MEPEKLKIFLKEYAKLANDTELLERFAPLSLEVSMPGGSCTIVDKDGEPLASLYSRTIDLGPSIPVLPHCIGFAKLFVEAANAALCGEKGDRDE